VLVIAPRARHGGLEIRNGFYGVGRAVTIPAGGARARLTFDVTLYADVKELLRRERCDVVHLHEPLMPVLPYMVLLNSQAVNVATFHAFRASNPWYTAFKPYMTFVLSRLDGRIAVSEPAREFVSQYFEGPYDVIPNGIDVDRFGAGVEPFPWANDGVPRLLFVGRFDESRKGFKYLLRALPMVRQQFPTARLLVVGTGKRERFEGVMERYGVRGVEFVGFVAAADLPRYYASCDVVCVPSVRNESFGIVLLEGMASGKPIVASRIPGYANVIDHESDGLLVEPRDPAALALALGRVLADGALRARLGAAGRVTAARYAWPSVAERVLEIYHTASLAAQSAPWRQVTV
ncbi:MAG: glycosyltransferase family 4 protein, partial [Chloroflexota bacterium]|nr:glycosyltransferase family 4 protein [Chloroflexota bacterium]